MRDALDPPRRRAGRRRSEIIGRQQDRGPAVAVAPPGARQAVRGERGGDLVDLVALQARDDAAAPGRARAARRPRAAAAARGSRSPSAPTGRRRGAGRSARPRPHAVGRGAPPRVACDRRGLDVAARDRSPAELRGRDREHPEPQPQSASAPAGSSVGSSSSDSRVVGCAPVPNACPGSIDDVERAGARPAHGGRTRSARRGRRRRRPVPVAPALVPAVGQLGGRDVDQRVARRRAQVAAARGSSPARAVDRVLDVPSAHVALLEAARRELDQLGEHDLRLVAARRGRPAGSRRAPAGSPPTRPPRAGAPRAARGRPRRRRRRRPRPSARRRRAAARAAARRAPRARSAAAA